MDQGDEREEVRFADRLDRCFLYLVNYARMKPEVALKALPILSSVCAARGRLRQQLTDLKTRISRTRTRLCVR